MSEFASPNHRESLSATSSINGQNEYLWSTSHALDVYITGGGSGGTQYTEGTTTSPAVGTAMLGRYESSPSGVSTEGGLYAPLMDSYHQLKVVPVGTIAISAVSLPLPSGASTSALQTTGNTSLATIATNTTGIATSANQTNGTQQGRITDGTNVANTFAGDSGFNGLVSGNAVKTVAFTTTTVQAVGSTDAASWSWVSVQITSQGGSSNVTFQCSDDNTNWLTMALVQSSSTTSAAVGNSTSTGIFSGPLPARYFRLNVTGIASGTTAGVLLFKSTATGIQSTGVSAAQNGTWTVGSNSATASAVPANAFYQGISDGTNLRGILGAANALNSTGAGIPSAQMVAQVDDTSPTVITENQFGNVRMSADHSLLITTQNSYAHISTSTTTTVKSGAGTLRAIIVNTLGTVASTTTIYDNTAGSGTVIGIINTLALGGTFTFDVQFATGLTLVTTGTVAPDITVSYK